MTRIIPSDERFRAAFDRAPVGLAVLDRRGRLLEANEALSRTVGAAPEDLAGTELAALLLPEDRDRLVAAVAAVDAGSAAESCEVRVTRTDRPGLWCQLSVSRLCAETLVVHVMDISSRKAVEEDLLRRALQDPLTGLANRVRFRDRLEAALQRGRRRPGAVGVLFLDLDDFKPVNDRYGHAAGDELLVAVARRLAEVVRPEDTVARLGGDEFGIVVEGPASDGAWGGAGATAVEVAERLTAALHQPLAFPGREIRLTVSVGIAVCHDPAATVERMLAAADAAMYRAKAGRATGSHGAFQVTRLERRAEGVTGHPAGR